MPSSNASHIWATWTSLHSNSIVGTKPSRPIRGPKLVGPETSADPNFSRHFLATACPTPLDVGFSDSVLEDVFDLLDQGVPDRSRPVSEENEASQPNSVTAQAPEPLQIGRLAP
jgi:hypothetical protein